MGARKTWPGLFGALGRLLFGDRGRAGPPGDPAFWMSGRLQGLLQGSITDPFREHPWVFKAILAIAQTVSSIPFVLKTGDDQDAELVESGPWYDLFLSPNPELTRREIWALTITHMLQAPGDAFWVLYGRQGLVGEGEIPVEVQVFPGSMFTEKVSERTGLLDHWELRRGNGVPKRLDPHQVIQFPFLRNPRNPRRALSPMEAAQRTVRTDDKAARWNEAMLNNGAVPSGVLSSADEITDAQARGLKARWKDRHGGADKAGDIAVLGKGFTFQPITTTHKDMGFLDQRKWSREEVSCVFGVPLMLMGVLEDVHKETSRQVRKTFYEGTIIPLLVSIADTLEARLFAGRGTSQPRGAAVWGAFDLAGIAALQEEDGARRENAAKDRALGVPLNQIIVRHELGYEAQGPSGDVGLVPMSLQTVESAAMEFEDLEPEPTPDKPEPDEEDADRAVRRDPKREIQWRTYIRAVHRPGEKRMHARVRGWLRGRRADTLRALEEMNDGRSARALSDDEVTAWIAEQKDRWHGLLAKQTKPVTVSIVDSMLDRVSGQIGGLQVVDMEHPRVLEHIEAQGGAKIKTVETVQKQVRRSLLAGLAEGENLADLQDRVRGVFRVANNRSLTIARTETGAAAQGAKQIIFEEEGIERHSWLTSGLDTVRDTHQIDGEIRNVGEPFSNGLLHPNDPNGAAEEVINCNCDTLAEV